MIERADLAAQTAELKAYIHERITLSEAHTSTRIGHVEARLDVLNGQVPKQGQVLARHDERLKSLEAREPIPASLAIKAGPEPPTKSFIAGVVFAAVALLEVGRNVLELLKTLKP